MPARLQIHLSESEEQELFKLIQDPKIPFRTRKRAQILCLNAQGWRVKEIADKVDLAPNTIRRTIERWIFRGKEGLWDAPRSGRKKLEKKES